MTEPQKLEEEFDLPLLFGGPAYRILRKAHMEGGSLRLAWGRVAFSGMFVWLPLLLLTLATGTAFDGGLNIPFLYDLEAHARFLIALPLLISAEWLVHTQIGPLLTRFIRRGIIRPADMAGFRASCESAKNWLDSIWVELFLLILIYSVDIWLSFTARTPVRPRWYIDSDGLTLAGYWYVFISIPIFQFMLLRWYLRFVVWAIFLWRVSRLDLRLTAAYPDRAAGLGFLSQGPYSFWPLLSAQGILLAGVIANRVLFDGENLNSFRLEAAGMVVFFSVIAVIPLFVFMPKLSAAKREGLSEYNELAGYYVRRFHEKREERDDDNDDKLLAGEDMRSLAELGESYAIVREMRTVPFGVHDLLKLAAAAAVPLAPLCLTVFSPEELVVRIIKLLF